MTPALVDVIMAHVMAEAPREACGLLIAYGAEAIYVPCRNIAEVGCFAIHPEDWAACEDCGEILGVVHSHPEGTNKPSEADLSGINSSSLPWWIFSMDGSWSRTTPTRWELVGRQFVWGVQDCYTLASDWFGGLPEFLRSPGFWKTSDLFLSGLDQAGFRVVIGEPEPGDALLFAVHGKHADHCAVYVGHGRIVHQPTGRLGVYEDMGRLVEKVVATVRRAK